jgi:hypothetical protein
MKTAAMIDEETLVIPSGWIKKGLILYVPICLLGVGYILLQSRSLDSGPTEGGVLFGFIVFTAVFWPGWYFSTVRLIEISNSGIVFSEGLRRIPVPWTALVPPAYPYSVGSIVFQYYGLDGRVCESDNMPLTKTQARGILTHPNCPPFDLDPRIWASIGLQSPIRRDQAGTRSISRQE